MPWVSAAERRRDAPQEIGAPHAGAPQRIFVVDGGSCTGETGNPGRMSG